jgi:hypothetical protein
MKIAFLHGPPPEKERPATVGTEAGRNVESMCDTASITDFAKAKAIASKKRLHDRAFKLFCGIPRRAFSEDALDTLVERLFDLRAGRNKLFFLTLEERGQHWLDAPHHSKLKRDEREIIAEVLDDLLEDAKLPESDAREAIIGALDEAARWHRSGARMVA